MSSEPDWLDIGKTTDVVERVGSFTDDGNVVSDQSLLAMDQRLDQTG